MISFFVFSTFISCALRSASVFGSYYFRSQVFVEIVLSYRTKINCCRVNCYIDEVGLAYLFCFCPIKHLLLNSKLCSLFKIV